MAVILAGPRSRLITPPALEPVTLEAAKIWCGFDWPANDPREPMLQTVIAAARAHVEDETALALLTQTREFPVDAGTGGALVVLPPKCRPVQAIASITWTDDAGDAQPIDPTWYTVDPGAAVITLRAGYAWPSAPLAIRVIAGWPTVAELTAAEPRLVHLVGRLVAHNMTIGRDLAVNGTVIAVPMGYDDEIQPYRPQTVA